MDYKMALELRDAGFPQNIEVGSKICTGLLSHPRMGIPAQYPITTVINVDAYTMSGKMDWVKYPTLEELIEACMVKDGSFDLSQGSKWPWISRMNHSVIREPEIEGGSTPTEAVARLYLALHPKK